MRLISINEKTHTKRIYEKKKEMEENLQIMFSDKQIVDIGFNHESLREKLIEFEKRFGGAGKNAVWRGNVTENFKKWLRGEKIYPRSKNKEKISLYLPKQKKKEWYDFIEANENFTTLSELIRVGIDYYIQHHLNGSFIGSKDLFNISFMVKESLTAIKGFSQLLLEEYIEELSPQVVNTIENIYEQCVALESKISNSQGGSKFDVLLIEDESPTINLSEAIFKKKGCSFKIVTTGKGGLDELKSSIPKLILLDIMLPDIVGYEVCKQIKANKNLKNVPVFYVTAIPDEIVKNKIEETGADGYILKPSIFKPINELLDSIL
ncbi:MAG: PleD family two-component system response regulator [Promethearchaeota archaeon]